MPDVSPSSDPQSADGVFPGWGDAFLDERDARPSGVSDLRYRALLRNLPDTVVAMHDRDLRVVTMEGQPMAAAGVDGERFAGRHLREFLCEDDVRLLEPHYHAALRGEASALEFSPTGRSTTYRVELVPLLEDGEVHGVVAVARNISERKLAEQQDRQRSRQQSAVARLGVAALEGRDIGELMDEAIAIVAETLGVPLCELLEMAPDHEALVLRAGTGWRAGLVRQALIPVGSAYYAGFAWGSRGQVKVDDYADERRFRPTPVLAEHGARSGMAVVVGGKRRPLGVLAAHSIEPRAFRPDEMDFLQAVANVLAEAIARQLAEDQVRHQALHDPLTGLPNRTLLLERLGHWLDRAERNDSTAAVVFVDVDHFKVVNDALGHTVGDELLRQVADRLRAETRPSDTVARVGGDEFVVFCEDLTTERDVLGLVDRIGEALTPVFELGERRQHVTASIGIAFAERGVDAGGLVRNADAAMYRAKERGRARYEVFDEAMRERSLKWLRTEEELRQALDRGELSNHYQPIVAAADGRIVGFEALVRWNHPERGTVSPADFIPVAEQSGLILPLGRAVLREACAEVRRWHAIQAPGAEPLRISVNLSPRQLVDPGLVSSVADALEENALEPQLLSLEITESALVDDAHAAMDTLGRLKELGVNLHLDDFGTGYSSLTYVRRFPIDALKIDRSFVSGLAESAEDGAIVNAVISMARALGVNVVAEGVETEDQAALLRSFGCLLAQGYLFSRPVPADAVAGLLTP